MNVSVNIRSVVKWVKNRVLKNMAKASRSMCFVMRALSAHTSADIHDYDQREGIPLLPDV